MRRFRIVLRWSAQQQLAQLRAEGRTAVLFAVGKALAQLEAFPESAPAEWYHGRYSKVRRKLGLLRTPYLLRYRLHVGAELIEVFDVRHEKRRPPR
jgi:hypothetical protein